MINQVKYKFKYNKAHAANCKKWHAIFAFAKAVPLFATADVRRYEQIKNET